MTKSIWTDEDVIITPSSASSKSPIWTDEDVIITPEVTNQKIDRPGQVISGIKAVEKGLARGAGNIIDFPFALYDLAATGNNWLLDKTKNPIGIRAPISNFRPGTSLLTAFQNKTGYNLMPNKDESTANRWLGTIGEYTTPGGVAGALGKAGNAAIRASNAVKGATAGAKLGAVSGALQVMGMDPLAADITATLGGASVKALGKTGIATTKAAKSALKGTSPQEDAAKILRKEIGEENLDNVVAALNNQNIPFNAPVTTAEAAFDITKGETPNLGLARLQRAFAPNSDAITHRGIATDDLIRQQLHGVGDPSLAPTNIGDRVRSTVVGNRKALKEQRAKVTKPLYEELYQIQDQEIPKATYNYIDQHYVPPEVTGEVKELFDYFNKNLKRNASKSSVKKKKGTVTVQEVRDVAPAHIQAQIDAAIQQSSQAKTPGQLDRFLTGTVKPRLNRYSSPSGNNETLLRYTEELKNAIEQDLRNTQHRKKYAELSEPINTIEQNPLLKEIITQDQYKKRYSTASDKISDKILDASTESTAELMRQLKGNDKATEAVRSAYIQKLFKEKNNLTYSKINKFNHDYREKIPLVFTEDQTEVFKGVEKILHRRHLVQNVGRATGSNTQSETTLLNSLFTKAGSSTLYNIAKKIPGGGMLYKQAVEKIAKQRELAIKDVLGQALADPEFAKMLLQTPNNVNAQQLSAVLKNIGQNYKKDLRNPIAIYQEIHSLDKEKRDKKEKKID